MQLEPENRSLTSVNEAYSGLGRQNFETYIDRIDRLGLELNEKRSSAEILSQNAEIIQAAVHIGEIIKIFHRSLQKLSQEPVFKEEIAAQESNLLFMHNGKIMALSQTLQNSLQEFNTYLESVEKVGSKFAGMLSAIVLNASAEIRKSAKAISDIIQCLNSYK